MNFDEYQRAAIRTLPRMDYDDALTMAVMGLSGEAAETMEMIKKYRFHGHDLESHKLRKELGDVQWYLAVLANLLGFSLDGVAQANIAKLERRYPDGFSADASRNRTE